MSGRGCGVFWVQEKVLLARGAVKRLLMRLTQRWWIARIDAVLLHAYRSGAIGSRLLHELDERLKRRPGLPWPGSAEGRGERPE